MAIDKSRTSPLMKTGIISLAAIFVLGFAFAGLSGMQGCSTAAPLLPNSGTTQNPTTPASTDTTASLQAKYAPETAALEASLTANPKDYNLLVAQGNLYLDWANASQNVLQSTSPTSNPLWGKASTYYARALAIKSTDAPVLGDYGISLFFSGNTEAAIVAGEKARVIDPTLDVNLFMLGQYYGASGNKAKAIEAFQAYLKVSPNGQMASQAQANITQLNAQ